VKANTEKNRNMRMYHVELKKCSFESIESKTYARVKGHYTLEGVNTTNSIANRKGAKQNSTYNDVIR